VGGFTPQWSGDGKTLTLTLNDPLQDLKFYISYWVGILNILNARNFTNSGIDFCSNFYIIFRIEEFSDANGYRRMQTDGGGYNASV
jgi:hypothetical protein